MIPKKYKKYIPLSFVRIFRRAYNATLPIYYYIKRGTKVFTYAGYPLQVYIFDHVSSVWYEHNSKRNEINFLRRQHLKIGDTVFNIGCHHGVVAMILSKIVGASGKVIAVEMDPKHATIAQINKKNNHVSNLTILNAAVDNKAGIISFSHDQVSQKNKNDKTTRVRAITVDMLTEKFGIPSLLFIDVEGFECEVLKGAHNTLQAQPDCCIEVHVNYGLEAFNGSIQEIISYFPDSIYDRFIAPAVDDCTFQPYKPASHILKDRFYLVVTRKTSTY